MTITDEAREAFMARRWQAHPAQPPVELWTLRDTLGFLGGLALVLTLVVLFLAQGGYPA